MTADLATACAARLTPLLTRHGWRNELATASIVSFAKAGVMLALAEDPISGELSVRFTRSQDGRAIAWQDLIRDMSGAFGVPPALFARPPETCRAALESICDALEGKLLSVLTEPRSPALAKAFDDADRTCDDLTWWAQYHNHVNKARVAWERKDFAAVIEHYEAIAAGLPEHDARRLAYARKRIDADRQT